MIELSRENVSELARLWSEGTTRELLQYAANHELIHASARLREHLVRLPRHEAYDESIHAENKADWLADNFFGMYASELHSYAKFLSKNTPYSTQHGVKGEEYQNVMVVFDDVEAAWSQYSFTKLLVPQTAGIPTEGQRERGRKLAYVCFSRARENLRILLFTAQPAAARLELIARGLFRDEQIVVS
jgi:DNA helicase-2/ATP-dependent DNA helicase PcrA